MTQSLVHRYVALWNEPDAKQRRATVEELWTEDGLHVLHPPQEIREAAARLGFDSQALEARGHDALEARVEQAYREFVQPGQYRFRARPEPVRLHNLLKLGWEMVTTDTGEVVGGGTEILLLTPDGRITADYQFPG